MLWKRVGKDGLKRVWLYGRETVKEQPTYLDRLAQIADRALRDTGKWRVA